MIVYTRLHSTTFHEWDMLIENGSNESSNVKDCLKCITGSALLDLSISSCDLDFPNVIWGMRRPFCFKIFLIYVI